ncbi:MAG: insulinase family protein [Bacteroidales bacterium]|nr:insulinase family protein [Bacteroidales bacterium]
MKKLFLSVLFVAAMAISSFAQQVMPCPMDPNVRIGKLDNGLTYYIRHNEKPSGRADFYIAQKVGSVLEEESQRGLAHFLEHMAFNGTTNLPGMTLREYLQSRGIKFGENLNAGTGIDQTVYMITNVPTDIPGLVDTCLLILHDWSSFIALEEAEIDNERGVILEELRTREDASERIMKEILPIMYPNSPYANRLPGGLPEVVANFEYQTLRDYYHKWYRPDLQGLIIVGDVDVDAIETRIKEMCADIPTPVNPAPRPQFMIEDNDEPIVAIASDPEATNYRVNLYYKQEATPDSLKNDINYWIAQYMLAIVSEMEINRLQELVQKPNPPFVYGYSYYSSYYIAPTEDAWTSMAMAKDAAGIDEALTALVTENKRMQQYGFTASEYERAKADFMKRIESQYNERNNTENSNYVDECLNNFLSNEPMMGIETEYAMYQQIVPNLPLEVINMMAQQLIPENNLVITVTAPKKEDEVLPTREDILNFYNAANAIEVEPYQEEVFDGPIVPNMPKPGKIKKEADMPEFDAKVLTLSNGMKVYYKKTTFKEDEIRFTANSWGGLSTLKQEDFITLSNLGDVITLGGVGNFSATDLPKVLAGKKVRVTPYIGNYSEGMSGNCSPKDLETMMQLIYLYFTAPRTDEEAFQSYAQRAKAALVNQELNPMTTFSDSLIMVLYNNHPLRIRTKAADIDKIDYAKAMDMYKQCFADPKNFTFYFVGNIDEETFKPLVEQYLASLKKGKGKNDWKDIGLGISEKDVICHYEKEMQNPKVTIYMTINGLMEYNYRNIIYMDVLGEVMDIYYTRTIREEEGGTYGVGVYGTVNDKPKDAYMFLIAFDTNLDMYEKLMGKVRDGLNDVATNGPAQEDLSKVVENLYKKRAENKEENSFWISAMSDFVEDNINIDAEFDAIVKSITPQTIADFAKEVLKGYNKEVVQMPTK